ncbi:hypothetical protein M427DRAFT_41103 [Gonapodya prolifera JEL478]|uniref:DUF3626 domain-containing protein n=1 Tax=Gonapodya prolifera (strain JEL478) TaxID=1344416 RepID=A0A139AW14_GONPJ|nr:hypothetical protein M427DRAFT_41103 [Gonapodya prolifera JEL478]|eukprot:KXS20926.1 hypothetical protein M427DRAFT_41103 [Gonapodya prolifera JEL478]
MDDPPLHPTQIRAIRHVEQLSRSKTAHAVTMLDEIFRMSNIASDEAETLARSIRKHARVALHFHPDRPLSDGATVAESLLAKGRYTSQWVTGVSNGGVSAWPGGARDEWERRLFGGAFHDPELPSSPHHRPKYGALHLMGHPDGPAPRFGSCYILLKPRVSRRCTFTWLDSHANNLEAVGTSDSFVAILAKLFQESFTRDFALGEHSMRPPKLFERITSLEFTSQDRDPAGAPQPMRNLDHYIEAQIHGDIDLLRDAYALVADPSFQSTPCGDVLERLASTYSLRLLYHSGYSLAVDSVPPDFRGPTMPSIAARIARDGVVDARAIGDAVRDLRRDPAKWADRGSEQEVLQELKLMWHVVVKFEEEPLLSSDSPATRAPRSTAKRISIFLLYGFVALASITALLSVTDMGWNVFREISVNADIKFAATVLNDVKTWPRWDVDLKRCDLDNGATAPAVGVSGTLHMRFNKSFPMSFVEVNLPDRVAYSTPFPGANLIWYWQFPPANRTATTFTAQMGVSATGPLSWAYGLLLKSQSLDAFDKCLPLLKKCIEGEATGNPVPYDPEPDSK